MMAHLKSNMERIGTAGHKPCGRRLYHLIARMLSLRAGDKEPFVGLSGNGGQTPVSGQKRRQE